jgi:hypothetical protein
MRFENCVRSILAFFAALIGFGLKHILDADPNAYGDIAVHRWQYFLVSVFLFLRFFLGSANHLWFEHLKPQKPEREPSLQNKLLLSDLCFLIGFGLFAAVICYVKSPLEFCCWSIALIAFAILWGICDEVMRGSEARSYGDWGFWRLVNTSQFVLFGVALLLIDERCDLFSWEGWTLPWSLLLLSSFVIFIWDVRGQLAALTP